MARHGMAFYSLLSLFTLILAEAQQVQYPYGSQNNPNAQIQSIGVTGSASPFGQLAPPGAGSPFQQPPQGASPFWQQPAPGGSPFGAQQPGGSPFGQQPVPGGSPFEAQQPGGSPFGLQAPFSWPPVGQQQPIGGVSGSPFGNQQQPGAGPGGSPFGQQPVQGGPPVGNQQPIGGVGGALFGQQPPVQGGSPFGGQQQGGSQQPAQGGAQAGSPPATQQPQAGAAGGSGGSPLGVQQPGVGGSPVNPSGGSGGSPLGVQQPGAGGSLANPSGGQAATGGASGGQAAPGGQSPSSNSGTNPVLKSSDCPAPATASQGRCPEDDNQDFITADGSFFLVQCFHHHWTTTISTSTAASFPACIELCASTPGCQSANFFLPDSSCALLSTSSFADESGACQNHHFAVRVDPPETPAEQDDVVQCTAECPGADGQIYNSPFGAEIFLMDCGKRHGSEYLRIDRQANLQSCIDSCAAYLACHSVDYHKSTKKCYYSYHQGKPTISAPGFDSAHSLGCAGACGGRCGSSGGRGNCFERPKLPAPLPDDDAVEAASAPPVKPFDENEACPGVDKAIRSIDGTPYQIYCHVCVYTLDILTLGDIGQEECYRKCHQHPECKGVDWTVAERGCHLKGVLKNPPDTKDGNCISMVGLQPS